MDEFAVRYSPMTTDEVEEFDKALAENRDKNKDDQPALVKESKNLKIAMVIRALNHANPSDQWDEARLRKETDDIYVDGLANAILDSNGLKFTSVTVGEVKA